ncbi:hypothetical protein Ppa06_66560 [Planomonospora parontospora subsp. parontospora]|uniref:DUF998 domain-containing protein n=3 Tax=Planomonospora parontospora TaxID=58119 RepID=A0AA37BNX6_9ACTN|nr:hypothetical protein GCM10010126_66890 [Planomonospora parontospora]GII12858.1 hypothetical protein Ppa06_66560 [Planomonospora parontospora subsp. parontospora]
MLLGYAAIGAGAVSMIGLHVAAGLDPLHTVISEYAFEPDGWLLPTSLTLFAVGATAFAVLLARRGEDRKAALLVGVWGLCMLLVGAFPTDRPGVPLSMSGGIHRYAAFAAFLAMPIAGLILARRHEGRPYARAVKALSLASLGVLVLVVVPYAVRMLGLEPAGVPTGAIQRLVVVSEVAVLAMLGLVLGSGPVRGRGRPVPAAGGAAGGAVAGRRGAPARADGLRRHGRSQDWGTAGAAGTLGTAPRPRRDASRDDRHAVPQQRTGAFGDDDRHAVRVEELV